MKTKLLWTQGDLNGFFGFGTNVLLNLLVMSGLLLHVIEMPSALVFGKILPAVGLMLFLGNIAYAYMAYKLSVKTNRNDVTALPSGPSVPHMFVVVLVIMLPVKIATNDPILAWQAGLVWVFIEGLVLVVGAYIAKHIVNNIPKAALLGTLAGISITFIAMAPFLQIFLVPWIGVLALFLVIMSFLGKFKLPKFLPAGLVLVIMGIVLGWSTGYMKVDALVSSFDDIGLYLPTFAFSNILAGAPQLLPLLVTAIPFGVYDFVEALNNVESARQAGDDYSTKEVLLFEGSISLIGTCLGSCFANAVYIGHPGWKSIGGRIGYSVLTGVVVLLVCFLGLVSTFINIIPLVAIYPILVYIGLVVGAQAFQGTPPAHAPAIILAFLPNLAAWGLNQVNGALATVGANVTDILPEAFARNGVYYDALQIVGSGAVVLGLIWGALAVFVIDNKYFKAGNLLVMAGVLTGIGLLHSDKIQFFKNPYLTLTYVILGVGCYLQVIFSKKNKTI